MIEQKDARDYLRNAEATVREGFESEMERLESRQESQRKREAKAHGVRVGRFIRAEQKLLKRKRRTAHRINEFFDARETELAEKGKGRLGLFRLSARGLAKRQDELAKERDGMLANRQAMFDQKIAAVQKDRMAVRAEREKWIARREDLMAREKAALAKQHRSGFQRSVAAQIRRADEARYAELSDGSKGRRGLDERERAERDAIAARLGPEKLGAGEQLRQEFRSRGQERTQQGGFGYVYGASLEDN